MDEALQGTEDALAFIEGLRLMTRGKPGFGWLDAKLEALRDEVGGLVEETASLRGFLVERGLQEEYERWRSRGVSSASDETGRQTT